MSKIAGLVFFTFLVSGTGLLFYVATTHAYEVGHQDAIDQQQKYDRDFAKFERSMGICTDDEYAKYVSRYKSECPVK